MLDLSKISNQSLNVLFSFLSNLTSIVFWVSSYDYKKQLYVNKAYEHVWGRSTDELQAHPKVWAETLFIGDKNKVWPEIEKRSVQAGSSQFYYRIHRSNGELAYLKNTSLTLIDSDGNPKIVTGIDETLSPDLWQQAITSPTKIEDTVTFLPEFITILQKETGLYSTQPQKNPIEIGNTIFLDGTSINLAPREAQCLKLLLEGKSAKQTATMLNISTRTVEIYLNSLRRKTHCRSKIELLSKLRYNQSY